MRIKVSDPQSGYFEKEGAVISSIHDEFRTNLFVRFDEYDFKVWFDISQIQFIEDKVVENNDGENSNSTIVNETESSELPNS